MLKFNVFLIACLIAAMNIFELDKLFLPSAHAMGHTHQTQASMAGSQFSPSTAKQTANETLSKYVSNISIDVANNQVSLDIKRSDLPKFKRYSKAELNRFKDTMITNLTAAGALNANRDVQVRINGIKWSVIDQHI